MTYLELLKAERHRWQSELQRNPLNEDYLKELNELIDTLTELIEQADE